MKKKIVETVEQEINESEMFFLKEEHALYNTSSRELYFRHKNIWLFRGDSLDECLFDKEFIDLTVTSPPYNVGIEYNSNDDTLAYEHYLDFSHKWINNCFSWTKKQGRLLLNIPLDKNKGGHRSVKDSTFYGGLDCACLDKSRVRATPRLAAFALRQSYHLHGKVQANNAGISSGDSCRAESKVAGSRAEIDN